MPMTMGLSSGESSGTGATAGGRRRGGGGAGARAVRTARRVLVEPVPVADRGRAGLHLEGPQGGGVDELDGPRVDGPGWMSGRAGALQDGHVGDELDAGPVVLGPLPAPGAEPPDLGSRLRRASRGRRPGRVDGGGRPEDGMGLEGQDGSGDAVILPLVARGIHLQELRSRSEAKASLMATKAARSTEQRPRARGGGLGGRGDNTAAMGRQWGGDWATMGRRLFLDACRPAQAPPRPWRTLEGAGRRRLRGASSALADGGLPVPSLAAAKRRPPPGASCCVNRLRAHWAAQSERRHRYQVMHVPRASENLVVPGARASNCPASWALTELFPLGALSFIS